MSAGWIQSDLITLHAFVSSDAAHRVGSWRRNRNHPAVCTCCKNTLRIARRNARTNEGSSVSSCTRASSPSLTARRRLACAAGTKGGVFGWTARVAINWGKVITAASLALCVVQHGGLNNMRQVLYIGLHGSYLLYWTAHQLLVPEWDPFTDPATVPVLFLAFALIGVGFALPVWLAFGNPHDIAPWYAVLCIFTYVLGSTVNAGSDWYKAGAKAAGGGLVTKGPYTFSMRPNYLGDWLRYLSFAMVTGRPWALLLPAFVVLTNVAQMQQHIKSGKERYGDAFVDYASKVPAIVPGLGPAIPKSNAKGSKKTG